MGGVVQHPELNSREVIVLGTLRDLTKAARERDPEAPRPTFFDQDAIEQVLGMATGLTTAAGSLEALCRFGLVASQGGSKSTLAFAITTAGWVTAEKPRRIGIVVPRWLGGKRGQG